MKTSSKIFFTISIFLFIFIIKQNIAIAQIIVFTKEKRLIPENSYVLNDIRELCLHRRVVIYGIEAYREALKVFCRDQERIVAGILYLSIIPLRDYTYISLLPAPQHLTNISKKLTIIGSGPLDYYINDLQKYGNVMYMKIQNWYQIEEAIRRAIELGDPLLLLPDPILLDERAQRSIRLSLKNSQIRVINLLGKPLNIPNEMVLKYDLIRYHKKIREIYYKEGPLIPGILYPD